MDTNNKQKQTTSKNKENNQRPARRVFGTVNSSSGQMSKHQLNSSSCCSLWSSDSFWTNPQYRIKLDGDHSEKLGDKNVLLSLMQKSDKRNRRMIQNLHMGLSVFEVRTSLCWICLSHLRGGDTGRSCHCRSSLSEQSGSICERLECLIFKDYGTQCAIIG